MIIGRSNGVKSHSVRFAPMHPIGATCYHLAMNDEKKYPSDLAERFQVRMPSGLRDRIAEAAEQSNRSMNAEIVARLESSFKDAADRSKLEELYFGLLERHKALLAEFTMFLEADKEIQNALKLLTKKYGIELLQLSLRELSDNEFEAIKEALSSKDESWIGKVISDAIHTMEAKLRERKELGV